MANNLSAERRLEVLACLVNGSGVRRTEDMTGVHRDTIGRFAFAVGAGCERLHDALARDLNCPLVDMDEQHSWTSKRQVNVDPETDDTAAMGERWTWAALCRSSKMVIAWHVGKRDAVGADALVGDVRARLAVMPQITTDGCPLYIDAIGKHFGFAVDYAQTVKRYSNGGGKPGVAEKFSHAKGVDFIEKRVVFGAPDLGKATTYAIERNNLTGRQWNARLRRRTLCFSKRIDRHDAAIALFYVHFNLCHVPRNMRITPAMAAGITDHVWTLAELMAAALAAPVAEVLTPKALAFQAPTTTARALPEGRGFLRAVDGKPGDPSPAPVAPTPPAAPAVAVAGGQLDLLAWKPRAAEPAKSLPPKGTQLDLF